MATELDDTSTGGHRMRRISASRFVKVHNEALTNDYEVGEEIGAGAFGKVYKCRFKQNQNPRAVKKIPKRKADDENDLLETEFKILKRLDHPNVLKVYELYVDEEYFYFVTDLYSGGTLFNFIIENGTLREDDASRFMTTLLSTMKYCHQRNVVHRDIKPENILLDDAMEMDDLKLVDFGVSKVVDANKSVTDSCVVGSLAYMAPEMLRGTYSSKGDIWACGVLAFVVLGGYTPFLGTEEDMMKQIQSGKVEFKYNVWNSVSDEAKEFIRYLLTVDENERPTADEALNSPWLAKSKRESKRQFASLHKKEARHSLINMTRFRTSKEIKQLIYTFVASQVLSKEDKEKIDDVFRALDSDGSGYLNREDVRDGFKEFFNIDLTPQRLDEIFMNVDLSGSDSIDYSEFLMASMLKQNLVTNKTLNAAFELLDTDRDGVIDVRDLKMAVLLDDSCTMEDSWNFEAMIKDADHDGDGAISYNDFIETMALASQAELPSLKDRGHCSHQNHDIALMSTSTFDRMSSLSAGECTFPPLGRHFTATILESFETGS